MNKLIKIIACGLSLVVFSSNALDSAGTDTESSLSNFEEQAVEIITVTGSRPLGFFREQFIQAEDDFFAAYNHLVREDEFKIECKVKVRSFSHISRRSCEPKYVNIITSEMTQQSLGYGSRRDEVLGRLSKKDNRRTIEKAIAKKRKKHLANVKELVSTNPKLQQELLHLNQAKYALEQKKIDVFGEDWVAKEAIETVAVTSQFVEKK